LSSSTDSVTDRADSPFIKVGFVRRAHGVRGAMIVKPLSDDPARFDAGRILSTDNPALPTFSIATVQPHKDGLLVSAAEVTDRDHATSLQGTSLLVPRSARRRLDPDEYWPEQLVGLDVVDPTGHHLGRIRGVLEGAQVRLEVERGGGTYLVPFVAAIVTHVDIASGRVVVDAPQGLLGEP
jgi:16S rRNA processing protein RimM